MKTVEAGTYGREACPQAEEAVRRALEPESAAGSPAWEAHLRTCAACRAETAATRTLVARLRARTEAEPAPDLADRIIAALPPGRGRVFAWPQIAKPWAAAAAAALVFACAWQAGEQLLRANPVHERDQGAGWLARTQADDGSWDPAQAGGDPVYRPALTALAALALETHASGHRDTIDRAVAALVDGQQSDGAFAPANAAQPYNHGIVTCSLLAIAAHRPGAVAEPALRRGIAFIRERQTASGGWGYGPGESANTAITVWQIEALARARDLGWGDPDGHLRRGLRWLRAQAGRDGHFAYPAAGLAAQPSPTLDAMAAYALLTAGRPHPELSSDAANALAALRLWAAGPAAGANIYRDYFAVRALDLGGSNHLADSLRKRLRGLYSAASNERGSWHSDDAWGRVGGRLYATSFALLALN